MGKQVRSLLFIPATEQFLSKAKKTDADAVIYDLEDSVPANDKEVALQRLEQYLTTNRVNAKSYIRINRSRASIEFGRLDRCQFDGYMIPKFESVEFINDHQEYLLNKDIIALIETPMGLVRINEIASHERVNALAFGAEDYTCTVNMKNDTHALLYAKSRLVMFASAYGKFVYDTPSFNFKDLKKFEADVEFSGDLGFTGKLAIHPDQVPIINRVFDCHDYDYIRYIIEQFEASNTGVLKVGDHIYEKPHIERYKKYMENKPDK